MNVEIIHASNGNCHLHASAFLDRAVNFIIAYDYPGDPEYLWHDLAYEMRNPSPSKLCLAAIDEETGDVVGHLLAELQFQYGIKQVMITQLEILHEEPQVRGILMKEGWPLVEKWARDTGSRAIKCWARNERLARQFEKFGLQSKDYVIMELKLQAEGE